MLEGSLTSHRQTSETHNKGHWFTSMNDEGTELLSLGKSDILTSLGETSDIWH